MENKLHIQDNFFFKDLTLPPYHAPCFSLARSSSKLNPEGRYIHGKQQYTLVLGEHLKTVEEPQDLKNKTVTEPLKMLLLGIFLWETLAVMWIHCLQIKLLMSSVGYLKAESLNEKILGKKILALICICSSYFIAPNTMCVLYRGLRLTVCLWYALRSSDGRCYLNTSNLMLKCLEFPVDICTRALLPSQMKNIWNP